MGGLPAERWDEMYTHMRAVTAHDISMMDVFDGDAMLAPVRAPAVVVDGEKEGDGGELQLLCEGPEWGALGWQAGEKAWWAGIASEAERQWAAVEAEGRTQWAAVQAAVRAGYTEQYLATIIRLDWDAVGACYTRLWKNLEGLRATLWSPISTIARLEGALLALAAQERWAQAQATAAAAGGGGGSGGRVAGRPARAASGAAAGRQGHVDGAVHGGGDMAAGLFIQDLQYDHFDQ